MRHKPVILAFVLAVAVPLGVLAQALTYTQPFDGTPPAPVAYGPPGWDVQIHSRDTETWGSLEAMVADHGPACQGPPATHDLTGDYGAATFNCANHVMTSIQAGGYGVIYLTPPALADFSAGEAVIRWDMSTFRTSQRDWVDVWISPYDEHAALPLLEWLPDLAGAPRHAMVFSMLGQGNSLQDVVQYSDYANVTPGGYTPLTYAGGYETVLVLDKARRDTFEIRLSPTHVKVGMPAYNLWWVDTAIEPPLTWNQGVVQLGHHSYNPHKDCDTTVLSCAGNTWHWDNVSISPSIPFTIERLVSPRRVTESTPGGWTFPSPSVAGDMLQFAANSGPDASPSVDVSFDGGATWQTVGHQTIQPDPVHGSLNARSYWVPIPVGATSVQVQGHGGFWGTTWQAQDASRWQINPNARPPTRTPTPPVVNPTATATPLPTITPGPTSTATPEPPLPTTPPMTPTSPPAIGPTPTLTTHCWKAEQFGSEIRWRPLTPSECDQQG